MFVDQIGPEVSREQHFREVVEITEKYKGEKAVKRLNKLMEIHYSIHCHVWDQRSFRQFLVRANDYLDNVFTIVDYVNNVDEIIWILVNDPDPQLSFEMEKIMAQVKFDEKLSRFCRQLSWRRWPVFWFWWERMCHEKLWPTFKRWAGAIPSKWKQNRSYLILNNACRRMLGQRAVEK